MFKDSLLINPISARVIPAFLPHGLLYIAGYAMECGYSVSINDRNVENADVVEILQKTRPKVVGMGVLTGPAIIDAIYVSQEIKKFDPTIKIVWGGIHTTLCPESVLKQDFVDFVIIGDGEISYSKILNNVIKNEIPLESIDNLGYKDGMQVKYNRRSFVDLNNIPQPAWDLVIVENYIRKKFYSNRVLTINTSRGCPYKCSFCCVPVVHQGKWRGISAEKIVEQLVYLKEHYQIDGFQVDDDEFDINRSRILELCDLLQLNNINLNWSHFSRVNIIKEDVLKREVECGLKLIEFGVESGSERMLKFLNKKQTLEQIFNAYGICKNLKLKTSALFMIGLPTEETAETMDTVKMVKRLKPHLTICTIFCPYPGTHLFEYCIDNELFNYDDNLEKVGMLYDRTTSTLERVINTSNVRTELLLKIKRYFDRRNIFQEVKVILSSFKINRLIYYFNNYVLKLNSKRLIK